MGCERTQYFRALINLNKINGADASFLLKRQRSQIVFRFGFILQGYSRCNSFRDSSYIFTYRGCLASNNPGWITFLKGGITKYKEIKHMYPEGNPTWQKREISVIF